MSVLRRKSRELSHPQFVELGPSTSQRVRLDPSRCSPLHLSRNFFSKLQYPVHLRLAEAGALTSRVNALGLME